MTLKDSIRQAAAYRPLQYGVALFVIVGIIVAIGYSWGKRTATGKQAPYPKGKTVSDDWVRLQAPGIIKSISDALLGVSILSEKKALAIKPLLTIADEQVVYVYNEYNTLYHPGKPDESLYKDIADDYFGSDIFEEGKIKRQVMDRMLGLNLI